MHKYHIRITLPDRRQIIDKRDIDYVTAYLWLDHRIAVDPIYCETGKYGGTHYHGIARSVCQVKYSQVKNLAGFNIHFKPITSTSQLHNTYNYITKSQPTQLHKQFSKYYNSPPSEGDEEL